MAKSSKKRQALDPRRRRSSQAIETAGKRAGVLSRSSPTPEAITPARSRIMRSILQKNTKPEVLVRRLLHAMGFRFRLHQYDLPGRPDIVLRRHKAIIQVHGCFWHQHNCPISNIPRTRKDYWLPKLARNVARDQETDSLLRSMGWKVATVWECELSDLRVVAKRLKKFIDKPV